MTLNQEGDRSGVQTLDPSDKARNKALAIKARLDACLQDWERLTDVQRRWQLRDVGADLVELAMRPWENPTP